MPSETTGVIAERYALALFELADSQSALDAVAGDLTALKAMIADSADLRRLLSSAALTREQQSKGIVAVAQGAQFGALTLNFLGVLAHNRRLDILEGAINSFLVRLAARRGEVSAKVASAQPLTQAQFDSLTASLKSAFGGNVAFDVTVDPSLLGGLVVKVGSRMVDSSLKTKLQHLKLAMKGVG